MLEIKVNGKKIKAYSIETDVITAPANFGVDRLKEDHEEQRPIAYITKIWCQYNQKIYDKLTDDVMINGKEFRKAKAGNYMFFTRVENVKINN